MTLLIILLLPISGILKAFLAVNALFLVILDTKEQINIGTLSSIIQKNLRNVAIRTSQAILFVCMVELLLKALGDIVPESVVSMSEDLIVGVSKLAASLVDPIVLLFMIFVFVAVSIFLPNNGFLQKYIHWRDGLNSPLIILLTISSLTFFGGQAAGNMASRWEVSLRQENQSQQRKTRLIVEEIASLAVAESIIESMDEEAKQDFVTLLEYNYPIEQDVLTSSAQRSGKEISRGIPGSPSRSAKGHDIPVIVNINKRQAEIERLEEQKRRHTSDIINHSNVRSLLAESIELLLQQLLPTELQSIGKTYTNSFVKSIAESLSLKVNVDRFSSIAEAREWVRNFVPEAQADRIVERAPATPPGTGSKMAIHMLAVYFQQKKETAARQLEQQIERIRSTVERVRHNRPRPPPPR